MSQNNKRPESNAAGQSNHAAVKALIRHISGQANVLAIPRVFIAMTGDIKSALLLSQIVYWSDKGRDGWFYKSAGEWKSEIGLTRREVTRCLGELAPWVKTKLARANAAPTLHYRVNMERLTADMVSLLEREPAPILTKGENRISQNVKNDFPKMSKSDVHQRSKSLTETTHRPPTEITAKSEPGEKPARAPAHVPSAVEVYRKVANQFPDRSLYEMIEKAIGEKPEDLDRWGKTVIGWIAASYNKKNVEGMLDWFSQGKTCQGRPNGHQPAGKYAALLRGLEEPPKSTFREVPAVDKSEEQRILDRQLKAERDARRAANTEQASLAHEIAVRLSRGG